MENLTLDQINELIANAGVDVVATSAVFSQINASNEAMYKIRYVDANGRDERNNIFIVQTSNGGYRASINTLI